MAGRVFVVDDVLPTTPLLNHTPGKTTIDSSSVCMPGFRRRVPSRIRSWVFGVVAAVERIVVARGSILKPQV